MWYGEETNSQEEPACVAAAASESRVEPPRSSTRIAGAGTPRRRSESRITRGSETGR